MTQLQIPLDTEAFVVNRFSEARIEIESIERRDYPEESIFVVGVTEDGFDRAVIVGNALDHELQNKDSMVSWWCARLNTQ